jgi:hypothetical protein
MINLWPYALQTANNICNTIPDKEDSSSPLEWVCRTNVSSKLQHNHTFGCPVYALDNCLQANSRIPKVNPRAWLGINLGSSPRRKLCHTSIEFGSRVSITTVPSTIRWFLWDSTTISDKICMVTARLACNRAIESSYWRMDNNLDVGLLMGYVLYRLLIELESMDLDTFSRWFRLHPSLCTS